MTWGFVLPEIHHLERSSNNCATSSSLQRFFFRMQWGLVWLFFITGMMSTFPVFAKARINTTQLIDYLLEEKNHLTQAVKEAENTRDPSSEAMYYQEVEKNNALMALNKAKLANFLGFLANQEKLQSDFSQRLKQLQQFPDEHSTQTTAQEKIDRINTLNLLNKKTIGLLNDNIALTRDYQSYLANQSEALKLWKSRATLHKTLQLLREKENGFTRGLVQLYQVNLAIQKKTNPSQNFKTNYKLEAALLLNNQLINLNQYQIAELQLQRQLARSDFSLLKNADIRTLQHVTDVYKDAINRLADMEESLKKMVDMLKNEQPHLTDSALNTRYVEVIRQFRSKIAGLAIQEQTLQEDLENHQNALKKQISARKSLSEYRLYSWPAIGAELAAIPGQFYQYLKTLSLKMIDNYQWQETWSAIMIWLTLGLIWVSAFMLRRILKKKTPDKLRLRLSGHLYDGVLVLLVRNIPQLSCLLVLMVFIYWNHIPYVNYQLLVNLIFIALVFRNLMLIARLILLESITNASGKDVHLYYRLRWLLLFGGWATALMVFGHRLPLSLILQDLFNRLFMVFLITLSMVCWRSREIIYHLLHPFLKNKKRYLRHAIMMLVVLIPLTLFSIAIIGLVGYMNLAWTMSTYQVQLLLILAFYVLIRGLMIDALDWFSEWMIMSSNNGWLWIEVFLKPLDKIVRVLLVLLSLLMVFHSLGGVFDEPLLAHVKQVGAYLLINVSGIHITIENIVNFFLLACFFIWVAKWTREFGYRWLYRDSRDPGIRNSLSVFTQYAVIIIGGLITLRALGLDFGGMAVVIGGLAVGMGFGLRDFASNIVGGLMLLIERPVREGDLITIGEHEGKVAHIGIRSMRVSSWDNMEVLIPNAETFNKPFTNWTHQDSIVRTVVPIKVSRADCPILVQQLIFDVLAIIPEIVADPPCQVFLKQIDEALIAFEIRYFINVALYTRFEIRSKVLFAIMTQFKASGIKAPIPPLHIDLEPREVEISDVSERV